MKKTVYLLSQNDYGGMFSSGPLPVRAVSDKSVAIAWAEKDKDNSYSTLELDSDEPEDGPKLPIRVEAHLDTFDEAAQKHGYEADQGNSREADEALQDYLKAKNDLKSCLLEVLG